MNRTAPLRRWQRVNQVNPMRRLRDDVYRDKRRKFLERNPQCQVRLNPDGTIAHRHDYQARICGRKSTQVHHIRRRGKWYLDERYWLATEQDHHGWIERNGKEAERLGYVEDPVKIASRESRA